VAGRRTRRGYFSQINVIPFVDVTLVLLVIFMAAVPALLQGLKVDLPLTKTVEAVPKDADHVVITVRKDGAVFLDETPLAAEQLPERVRAFAGAKRIYVRADKELSYGEMVRIMDLIKSAGVKTINLVTEAEDGGGAPPPANQASPANSASPAG
jgi:biopolymer transport protein TolR